MADRRQTGDTDPREAGRANLLLGLGAALGLALAAGSLVWPVAGNRPDAAITRQPDTGTVAAAGGRSTRVDAESIPAAGEPVPAATSAAIATVNGQPIAREEVERAIAALQADRRVPMTDDEQRRVLDRIIDEELLLQRAIELGLVRRDKRVRNDLVAAMIDTVVAEATGRDPTTGELEEFHRANADRFAEAGRTRLRQVIVRAAGDDDTAARVRAEGIARRLREGEDFATVAPAGDPQVVPVPDTLLPPAKVVEYLGPTAARTALGLAAGEVSDPVRTSSGWAVVQVVEKDRDTIPDFAEVEPMVRAEWTRRNGDQALRSYLDRLRARAEVKSPTVVR